MPDRQIRLRGGELVNCKFKFSDEQIQQIRKLIKDGVERKDIAEAYNMSRSYLSRIEKHKIRGDIL